MLYNILPPLIFFASFGGVILVVSRVVMRVRREQLSQSMQMEARNSTSVLPEHFLNPGTSSVELLKNRMSALGSNMRQSLTQTKESWRSRKERKAQKAAIAEIAEAQPEPEEVVEEEESLRSISIPTASWREKTAGFFQRTTQQVKSAAENLKSKTNISIREARTTGVELTDMPAQDTPVATKKVASLPTTIPPQIRIIRVENPVASQIKKEEPASEVEASPVATSEAVTPSPRGRFIARLKKGEAPKPSTLATAQHALEAGQYDKAEELIVPYIIDHSRDCQAYILLGKVAAARNSWEEAMEIYEQAVRLDPEKSDAQAGLGHAALQQGKFTIALRALQRAHAADPTDIHILHQILEIARRLDNKILQKSTLEQLVELEPQDENVAQALATLRSKEKTQA